MNNNKILNCIFVGQLVLFGLIVTGILPRSVVSYLAIALAVYVLFASLEDATVLFVRSIPFFIAIPITATFDNFNTWRILSAIIFLKWIIKNYNLNKKYTYTSIRSYYNVNTFRKISLPIISLLFLSIFSIIPAPDNMLAIKRIIYFLNL